MKDIVVEYKKLQSGDELKFTDLVLLFNKEFESTDLTYVNSKNITKLLGNPQFVCLTALIGGKVVGGLTAHKLDMYDREGTSMYLYDLAVSKEYQRNGIGSRLVNELIAYCKSEGINELFVQADAVDQHAIEFYKKNGGESSQTFHFSFKL